MSMRVSLFAALALCVISAPSFAASQLGSQPICIQAWNGLGAKRSLAQTLITKNCDIMYEQGWLNNRQLSSPQTPKNDPQCISAWNDLGSDIEKAKQLVTHNCQILYNSNWIEVNPKLK